MDACGELFKQRWEGGSEFLEYAWGGVFELGICVCGGRDRFIIFLWNADLGLILVQFPPTYKSDSYYSYRALHTKHPHP